MSVKKRHEVVGICEDQLAVVEAPSAVFSTIMLTVDYKKWRDVIVVQPLVSCCLELTSIVLNLNMVPLLHLKCAELHPIFTVRLGYELQ